MSAASSADFYSSFQAAKRDIEAAISSGSAEATSKLQALKADLAAQIASLPTYDQRSCTSQVNELEAKVVATKRQDKPKSKFAFARSTPSSGPDATATAAGAAESAASAGSAGPSVPIPAPSSRAETKSAEAHVISNRTDALIRLPAADNAGSEGITISLSDIADSIIDLRPAGSGTASSSRAPSAPTTPATARPEISFSSTTSSGTGDRQAEGIIPKRQVTSLHAKSLRRCILIADVEGSAILHGLDDCLVVLSSHQFRIHSSRGTAILLHTESTPIIEHSDALYFGALPRHMGSKAGLSKYDKVQDFDWVKGGPSPNWRALGSTASEMLLSQDDADVIATAEEDEVEEIVERITGSMAGLTPSPLSDQHLKAQ